MFPESPTSSVKPQAQLSGSSSIASHPNRVFSADEIFERVWKQESVISAKTVMVHMSHLRDKIEEATDGKDIIKTVWGVGYKVEG